MSLIDLPTEIITQIVRDTLPDGYESLMLSCKAIHEVGREFLEKHNRLQTRYRNFRYDPKIQSVTELLRSIGRDPIIADYIKTADLFDDLSTDETRRRGYNEWHVVLDEREAGKTIGQFLGGLKLPDNAHFASQTRLDAFSAAELRSFATIVLMSLLRNVEEVVLPRNWAHFPPAIGNTDVDERNPLWRALESIVQQANSADNHSLALSKLSRIQLLHPLNHAAALGVQQHLSAFLILPSLRKLHASNCLASRAYLIGKPFTWRYPSQHSNLQRIEFVSSCIEGCELENLLRHTPHLQSFKLSYASKSFGCGTHWDVNEVFQALRNHTTNTLTELSLSIDRVGTVKGGLRSLKEFSKLEQLELDVCVFFGPEVTGHLLNMAPVEYRNYAYGVLHWNGSKIPSLADVLPCSINWVRLITGSCREDILILKSLFAHLGTRAANSLPHLDALMVSRATSRIGSQRITTGQPEPGWKSVEDVVNSVGFEYEEEEVVRARWIDTS